MSEYTITKSITSDFGGNFNSTNLKQEIENNQTIGTTLERIDRTDDTISIVFASEPPSGEQTELNTNVIPNHTHTTNPIYTNVLNLVTRNEEINTSNYKRCCSFIYEGSGKLNNLVKINAIGYMDSSNVTSYSIIVEDKTNGNVIAETSFTNTEESDIEITPLSNIPTSKARIEVSAKRNSSKNNKKAYVESVTFYFGV